MFVAVVLAAIIFLKNKQESNGVQYNSICFSGRCFNAEIASSFIARIKGLMFREFLADDAGMFFVFSNEDKYAFWMKSTLIPLDMIWISKNKEVVYIAKNVQPCKSVICPSVSPDRPALYVLEINGGKADEIGLKIGNKAEFELR